MKLALAVIFVIWLSTIHASRTYKRLTEAEANHEKILSFSREISAMVSEAVSEVLPLCKRKLPSGAPFMDVRVEDVQSYLSEAMKMLYIPGGSKYRWELIIDILSFVWVEISFCCFSVKAVLRATSIIISKTLTNHKLFLFCSIQAPRARIAMKPTLTDSFYTFDRSFKIIFDVLVEEIRETIWNFD